MPTYPAFSEGTMMTFKPAAVLAAVLLCAVTHPGGSVRAAQRDSALRIEGFALYMVGDPSYQQLTISFHIVNGGRAEEGPFRTSIFPGAVGANGLETYVVPTTGLAAGETVYVSRTVELPRETGRFRIRIEIDADGGGRLAPQAGGGDVVTVPFVPWPPPRGRWISIGPRRVTAPAVPELGLGQYDGTGRLAPIAVHPKNPEVMYVGSPGELGHEGCGVWKTSNGGISWQPVADSLPTLSIAAIAIDPTSPNRVYIVTADNGLYRSDDEGTSWKPVYSSDLNVRRNTADGDRTVLLIDPVDPAVLYLTTDDGVRRSDTSGASWDFSLPGGSATALVMDPLNRDVLYAALQGKGVYKTADGGTKWDKQPLPTSGKSNFPSLGILLALSHPNANTPATVYALLGSPSADLQGRALLRTTDGGTTWNGRYRCEEKFSDDCVFGVLAVDPTDSDLVYMGGPQLLVSTEGGTQFTRVPSSGKEDRQPDGPHGDYHGWAFDPIDPRIIYAATDGGIYRSSDRAMSGTWTFIGEGITNAEVYDLAASATPPHRIFAGTQDNGTMVSEGSVIWDHVFPPRPTKFGPCAGCGGDGALVAIDRTNADIFYLMVQFQDSLKRSPDAGAALFEDFANGLPSSQTGNRCAAFNSTFHFQVHPTSPTTLIASCGFLWRTLTTVPPGDWKPIFFPPGFLGRVIRSAIDPSINLYYAGSGPDLGGAGAGRIYAGPGGGSFQEVFQDPQSRMVSDIEVNPGRPRNVYASFAPGYTVDRNCSGPPAGRIYQLTRSSAAPTSATTTATDITGDLPAGLCVNTLAVDPSPRLTVYAGTQKGVYRVRPGRQRSGAWSWEPYNDGMPPADVRDLELRHRTGFMYAATFGRGNFQVRTKPARRQR